MDGVCTPCLCVVYVCDVCGKGVCRPCGVCVCGVC